MSDAAIQADAGAAKPDASINENGKKKDIRIKRDVPLWLKVVHVAASLRVTVVLFALAILLVFFGTLAQIDNGLWTVVSDYFRSAFVMVPLQIFVPRSVPVPGAFPFPGGWLIGSLLLTNLLAAHIVRFKMTWKRSGVLVLHAGLIVLMVSEFVTGVFSRERHMQIAEGQTTNFMESQRFFELAVIDRSDKKFDSVTVVPASILKSEKEIQNDQLPFDIEVDQYMVNSYVAKVKSKKPRVALDEFLAFDFPNMFLPWQFQKFHDLSVECVNAYRQHRSDSGAGLQHYAVAKAEVSGTAAKQEVDAPSAYITLSKNGKKIGTFLVSLWLKEQPVKVGGKTYDLILRFEREYLPFSLLLVDFKFERYTGSNTPKDYTSTVRLNDPEYNVDREVRIRMNQPLRYRGETFFQAGFDEQTEQGTILQVVTNPGWLMPYIACALVGLGMLIHFGIQLILFLQRRLS